MVYMFKLYAKIDAINVIEQAYRLQILVPLLLVAVL